RKDIPAVKDWKRFKGGGEYNHMIFIDWVSKLKKDMCLTDYMILACLGLVLEGIAGMWYTEKSKDVDYTTWEEWAEAIKKTFGTPAWRRRMQKAFDKTRLRSEDLAGPIVWATAQKQRLLAARPDILPEDMIIKILEQFPGDINHAVRSRMSDESDFIGFTEVLEEVIFTTSIGRQ
ncbi:hypothetical protein CROQUDRAFT_17012, partial [Cronartium quercuum f. sp. fusiforme G11]